MCKRIYTAATLPILLVAMLGVAILSSAPMARADDGPTFSQPDTDNPSAELLLNVWRQDVVSTVSKQLNVKILDFKLVNGSNQHGLGAFAYVRFKPLGDDGTEESWNKAECIPEFGTPNDVGIQVIFGWHPEDKVWTIVEGFETTMCSVAPLATEAKLTEWTDRVNEPVHPITLKDVSTPPAGSAERKAIMDALRPTVPDEFQPVKFKVSSLVVGGGFATASVIPLKTDHQPVGCAEGDDVESEYWLQKIKGHWKVIVENICGGDPAFDAAKNMGAPPQLLGKNTWKEVFE